MRHYGIKAEWKRKDGTSILMCQGLDRQGCADTRPVALQQTLTASIMAVCSRKVKNNDENRKAALQRLKDAYYESSSIEELQTILAQDNVELMLDRTKDGSKIFGVTLIDYNNRSAFKGSELDKSLINDIKTGIFRPRPREVKPYDPFEETRQVIEEFNRLAGERALWNPKVFGLRLDGQKVSLTYEGRDYIWMELNKSGVSMNRGTPQWMVDMASRCNTVFDMPKVFKLLVLSGINISRAQNPEQEDTQIREQSQQRSNGPKMH